MAEQDPRVTQAMQGASAGASGPGNATVADNLDSILAAALLGATGGVTDREFRGFIPAWVRNNPAALAAFRQGRFDPYIPTPNSDSWQVFVSMPAGPGIAKPATDLGFYKGEANKYGDTTRTASVVKNDPYTWSEDQVDEAIKKFRDAGMTGVQDFDTMRQAWGALVDRAAATYSLTSGEKKVTPWDVLDMYKREVQNAGLLGGGESQARTTTSVQRTVSEVDDGEAWDTLRRTASQLLGRDPSDQEVRDFAYKMNGIAAKNPTISRSTTTVDEDGNSTTSSRVKPGFTSADLARGAYEDAQSDNDYAEYQSATTYFNAVVSALGSIGGN